MPFSTAQRLILDAAATFLDKAADIPASASFSAKIKDDGRTIAILYFSPEAAAFFSNAPAAVDVISAAPPAPASLSCFCAFNRPLYFHTLDRPE